MRMITFRDGGRMPRPTYQAMMSGEISPFKAVAGSRREPAGAYDAAMPKWQARDQQNGGRLDGSYVRATAEYLKKAGVALADLDTIAGILDQYVDEEPAADSENLEMPPDPKIGVGTPRGQVGASDRRMALDQFDQFGRPRNLATPMLPGGDDRGFSKRFPEAARIRTA
jgi:hypothetical protein